MSRFRKIFSILINPFFRKHFLRTFVAASTEHTKVLQYFSETGLKTIVDIGANRGQFALAAYYSCPSATILSFEPLQEAVTVYRKIFQDNERAIIYPYAIGKQSGASVIHVSNADDSSSLLPITDLQNDIFPGTYEAGTRTITVKKLEEVVSRDSVKIPALMKIDVQGTEIDVLEGCGELLSVFDYIYVECSFVELYQGQQLADDVIAFLQAKNFRLNSLYNPAYGQDGLIVQADFLFIKKS